MPIFIFPKKRTFCLWFIIEQNDEGESREHGGEASLRSDLVFGFQQVLFDLIILFFEGLGILDHFLGFLDQVGGTVWVTEPKAL